MTVGAGSLLRSCKIEDLVIIGERCVIMEGSVIKSHSMLQPGTVVPPAKLIPSGQLWGGCPAQFIRKLTHDEARPPLACLQPSLLDFLALRSAWGLFRWTWLVSFAVYAAPLAIWDA